MSNFKSFAELAIGHSPYAVGHTQTQGLLLKIENQESGIKNSFFRSAIPPLSFGGQAYLYLPHFLTIVFKNTQ
ncbi:MAG TPA: hypothetical protein VI603_14170 [Saprospiraceae bacterium]|nr:hypothetical protein [Saprospiraceae bacterium]